MLKRVLIPEHSFFMFIILWYDVGSEILEFRQSGDLVDFCI
jgi:hypothetical protein